jgi:hypothetical protein
VATIKKDFADAALLAVVVEQLCEALRRPDATARAMIAAEFGRLADLVAALPLTTDEYCFAANWVASARRLFEADDIGACLYQLGIIRKRLAA